MVLYDDVIAALEASDVRYVVVGGWAVVLHGHGRLTMDLDLVVDLDPEPLRIAMEVLTSLGFRPRLPVAVDDFLDPAIRRAWIEEKGLHAFSMHDPDDPRRDVDVFATEPVPFDELLSRSVVVSLRGAPVRIAAIDDLIAMKQSAGRGQDILDIRALSAIRERRAQDDA